MRYLILLTLLFLSCGGDDDQAPVPIDDQIDEPADPSLYFPPLNSDEWETISPESLGWNASQITSLDAFVDNTNTRALLILKDGRIVYERYAGKNLLQTSDFSSSTYWYWASAAKTLTAFLIGRLEAQELINLDDPSNLYLGQNWTSLTSQQESQITIRHQLTMTTGLDYTVADPYCTDPECLLYLNEPEQQWFYHNAPYTLLDGVIEGASNMNFNTYFNEQLVIQIGMEGFWDYSGYNHIFYSPARSMARFGLLILAGGNWDGTPILENDTFYNEMINSSQALNPSYGYLWWLNGKGAFIPPGIATSIPSDITPNAPSDMFAAMGANGQLINIVPSQNLIIIRMGDDPDTSLVPYTFQDDLWAELNQFITD